MCSGQRGRPDGRGLHPGRPTGPAREYDPGMYGREPEAWRKSKTRLFGIVLGRAPGRTTPGDVTKEGVFDMFGNASEVVADFYDKGYYSVSPENDPKGPERASWTDTNYSTRGAGLSVSYAEWDDSLRGFPVWARNEWGSRSGFRCGRDVREAGVMPLYRGLAWRRIR